MSKQRAADDYGSIRDRLRELQNERCSPGTTPDLKPAPDSVMVKDEVEHVGSPANWGWRSGSFKPSKWAGPSRLPDQSANDQTLKDAVTHDPAPPPPRAPATPYRLVTVVAHRS